MKKYVLFLSIFAVSFLTTAVAQTWFEGGSGSNPVIYNSVSTTGSIRAANMIIPTSAAGVTPTAVKGAMAMTNGGDLCVYTGSTWIKLNAVSIITGLSVLCTF